MGRLSSAVRPVTSVNPQMRAEMYDLYNRYYGGTSKEQFMSDLENKQLGVLLSDAEGRLRGFSLLAIWELEVGSRPVRIIYSGDTIIDDRYWGDLAFPFTWVRMTGAIKGLVPDVPLYWCYLVMGYRTYRALPALYRFYYPNRRQNTPANIQSLIHVLGGHVFGSHYNSVTGVVRLPGLQPYLRQPWSTIPERIRQRPEIQFFLERNSGYASGDELVCLTDLTAENHKPMAARLFRDGLRDRSVLPSSGWQPVAIAVSGEAMEDGAALERSS